MTATVDIVAGARPNFMKVAPILRAFSDRNGPLRLRLVHTGQHYDAAMSDIFFEQLGIARPDVHLGVGSGSHAVQTANILCRYEEHLLASPVRGVIVVGDVNSTMACALVAAKLCVPVAHVEAGLRSRDVTMPEEINRVVTDAIADVLLVSEPDGELNLRREGVSADKIHYVGNVMIDTLARELAVAKGLDCARALGLGGRYVYVTLHRPSNVDDDRRLATIVEVLERIASQLPVVFAVHPRTRERLQQTGLAPRLREASSVHLLPPQGYRESLSYMLNAAVVLSDSGGIQEESSYMNVPCLTLRSNTERPVTVTLGTSTLVGEDLARIVPLVQDILAGRYKQATPIAGWDGRAAERIERVLTERWAR